MPYYVSDLAQLIHQTSDKQVSIVAHSLGGAISLRYAGIFPERVRRLAVIEGLGISPLDERPIDPPAQLWRNWITERRALSARVARRYATMEQAFIRMTGENPHLSADRARHLMIHGMNRNEDGTYTWKFDNYVRSSLPMGITDQELHELWHEIDCPVWLVHGANSFARHPGRDGRSSYFKDASVTSYEDAGHWVHHDRFDQFVADLKVFLAAGI